MPTLASATTESWHAHPKAAPILERRGDALVTAANGTRTCVGGWNVRYEDVEPGATYNVSCDAVETDTFEPFDSLRCYVEWEGQEGRHWEYLIAEAGDGGALGFSRVVTAPDEATAFSVRILFRWSTTGSVTWQFPVVETAERAVSREPVSIALVSGKVNARRGPFRTAQDNIDFYLPL